MPQSAEGIVTRRLGGPGVRRVFGDHMTAL